MKNFILLIIACWLSGAVKTQAQELTFISPLVEEGIRDHLNFTEEQPIGFAQLDTITTLDLSRRGITDIRDLILMPKLRWVDLSDNMVENLQPLAVLDSLEWVDLSYNSLRGVNELFYAVSKSMTVRVAFNHIRDFSLFGSISSCNFTLEGVGLQLSENAPFFDVSYFICDATESPVAINGLVFTNIDKAVRLVCGDEAIVVPTEGESFTQSLQYNGNETVRVIVTNGEQGDTTWVVPSRNFQFEADKPLSMETGLPDDYLISSVFAERGTAVIDGTKVVYTAGDDIVTDALYISYSDGLHLRGITKYNLVGDIHGDMNSDGQKNIVDVTQLVKIILNDQGDLYLDNADVNKDGRVDYEDVKALIYTILKKK